jgi:type I restriction enzyme, S subunit
MEETKMAQTEQNKVMPGYKQTEVGVISEDWEVKKLGEIGVFKNGINNLQKTLDLGLH